MSVERRVAVNRVNVNAENFTMLADAISKVMDQR